MYNGIGLQTPRGSGTSGYVQKNLSFVKPQKTREEFLKELAQLKENILPPPKPANKDIVLHQQKREIELHLLKMREKLESENVNQDEIELKIQKAAKILHEKFESGEISAISTKGSHEAALGKEREYAKMKKAFNMSDDYKPGSAFDFESQENKRLEKLLDKEKKKGEKLEQIKEERKAEKLKAKEEKRLIEEKEILKAIEEGRKKEEQDRKEAKAREKEKEESHRRTEKRRSASPKHRDREKNHRTKSPDKKNKETVQDKNKSRRKHKSESESSSSSSSRSTSSESESDSRSRSRSLSKEKRRK